ncbi:hypothetical protein Ancab_035147 [Ancistrocladus abbreviatus]
MRLRNGRFYDYLSLSNMGSNHITAARMLIYALSFSIVFTSGFEMQSTVCGNDHVLYSNSPGNEVFYINGRKLEKEIFCKAIHLHDANRCPIKKDFGNSFCAFNLPTDKLLPGRKLLRSSVKNDATSPQSGPQDPKNDCQFTHNEKIMGMAVPGMLIVACIILCPCCRAKRKESEETVHQKELTSMDSANFFDVSSNPEKFHASPLRHPHAPSSPAYFASPDRRRTGSVYLNYNDIAKATRNFSSSLLIGEGGFGTVYKARLPDGREVAIKRVKKEQFDSAEFDREVGILSKIDHRNLVKLLGYVDRGHERVIITEYVPNGTLRQHLDGEFGGILDFNQRLEIAIDVAHGLTYLHLYSEKQIIHRDVKSSNILLTESLRAKVSDFGFARVGPADGDDTHISTKVKGTVGYLDPEYMRTYQLTTKSDVYSFGILLLEMLTGRRPVESKRAMEERVLLRWASYNFNRGNVVGMLDPQMNEAVDAKILEKLFWLALQCAASVRADRPDMKEAGERLWAIRMDYQRRTS